MNVEYRESNKYNDFKLHPLNRDLNTHKLKKLIASMRKHGYIKAYPLNVYVENDYYFIKDGHHRFIAAKTLGSHFWFAICDDTSTIQEINDPVSIWTSGNYFNSFLNAGNEEYAFVRRFMDETGYSLSVTVPLLANQTGTSFNNFRDKISTGKYKVALNTTYAGTIAYMTNFLKKLGVSFYNTNFFVSALSKVACVTNFDCEIFMKYAKKNKAQLKEQRSIEEYINMIERIYNAGNPNQIPLAFLTKQAMKNRQESFIKKI